MIFVVSENVAEPESPLLEDVIPAPEPESLFTLLDETSIDELDSSTALLSVFSGPEPLESSPQATNSATAAIRAIFPRYLLKSFAIIQVYQKKSNFPIISLETQP